MIIGVLGLQGAVREHRSSLARLDVESRVIRRVICGRRIASLVMPGGSTVKLTATSMSSARTRVASLRAFLKGSAGLSDGLLMRCLCTSALARKRGDFYPRLRHFL